MKKIRSKKNRESRRGRKGGRARGIGKQGGCERTLKKKKGTTCKLIEASSKGEKALEGRRNG